MNYEIKILVEWLRANKLSLNESKTELIIFHSPYKKAPSITIKINSFKLVRTKYVNYLGILIDEVLSWNKQFEKLLSKLSSTIGALSKLRYFTPSNVLKSVYYGLFYSHVLYGCFLWQYSSRANIESLVKLQKKCIRMITFSEFNAHTEPLFYDQEILKIEDIFKYQLLKLVFFSIQIKYPLL